MTMRACLCLLALTASAQAATPTNSTVIVVSARVVPNCNDTSCRAVPRVVSYGPAHGSPEAPAFDLSRTDGRPVMTITY